MSKRRTSEFIILHSAFCILFLLAGIVEAQCLPGMGCAPGTSCAVPTQGWRPSLITPVPPQQPRQVGNPAIVRVGCQYRQTRQGQLMDVTDYGSGTICDRRDGVAYVLTCSHTFRDSGYKGRIFVVAAGRRYDATLLHADKLWDVAVLKIADPGIVALPLADAASTRGQEIWLAGFAKGRYGHRAGRLMAFRSPATVSTAELMEVSAGAIEGESGGPMIGVRGRVVGVISATDGRQTRGACLPRLRRILAAVLPPYPNRPIVVLPKPRQVAPMIPKTQVPVVPAVPPASAALLVRIAALEKQFKALQEQVEGPRVDLRAHFDMLEEEVQALRKMVAACSAEKGPPGEQGPIGKDGPRGPPGPAASAPAIDLDALAAKVLAKLPPVKLHLQYPDGKVVELAKPLGEGIVLPPQRVEWETLDGTVLFQEKPLGEPLRFKSIAIGVKK